MENRPRRRGKGSGGRGRLVEEAVAREFRELKKDLRSQIETVRQHLSQTVYVYIDECVCAHICLGMYTYE